MRQVASRVPSRNKRVENGRILKIISQSQVPFWEKLTNGAALEMWFKIAAVPSIDCLVCTKPIHF